MNLSPYGYVRKHLSDGNECFVKARYNELFDRLVSIGHQFECVLLDGQSGRSYVYDPSIRPEESALKGKFIVFVGEPGNVNNLEPTITKNIVNLLNVFPASKFIIGLKKCFTKKQKSGSFLKRTRHIMF